MIVVCDRCFYHRKLKNILETPLERRCQRGTEYMKGENSI